MKRLIGIVIVCVLIVLAAVLLLQNNTHPSKPLPPASAQNSPTPKETFCTLADIQTTITSDGAAGNIYGSLQIKNISPSICTIQGNQFIQATFSASNLRVVHKGNTGPATIALKPGQIVYSRIHYPNGPQCQGPTTQTPVTLTYAISSITHVTFKPAGNVPTAVTTCVAKDQLTILDVWSIYLNQNIQ